MFVLSNSALFAFFSSCCFFPFYCFVESCRYLIRKQNLRRFQCLWPRRICYNQWPQLRTIDGSVGGLWPPRCPLSPASLWRHIILRFTRAYGDTDTHFIFLSFCCEINTKCALTQAWGAGWWKRRAEGASAALLTTNRGRKVKTGVCSEAGKSCDHI